MDGSGIVYVADSGNNRIQKFTPVGNFLTIWRREGSEYGQCPYPHGVAVDGSGKVYVADTGNCLIQEFMRQAESKIQSP